MKLSSLFLCFGLAALACVKPAFADLDFSQSTYSVPVPRIWSAFSVFPLDGIEWRLAGNRRFLKYDLPSDLVGGKKVTIELQGKAMNPGPGFVELTGEKATASCSVTSRITCLVQYRSVQLFGNAPEQTLKDNLAHLASKYDGDPNLAAHLGVTRVFGTEPGGTVMIPAVQMKMP